MNDPRIRKSKWFWPWQDEKEESWLGQMARQGLHLQQVNLFGQYDFVAGQPHDLVYRLDFVMASKKDDHYYQLFRDAGWEHIGEMSGWQYWRKEIKAGETAEIFTDVESKIQKYQRLLGFLAIIFLPIFMGAINMRYLLNSPYFTSHWIEQVFAGIAILIFTMLCLYIYIFIRIGMRIRELKRL